MTVGDTVPVPGLRPADAPGAADLRVLGWDPVLRQIERLCQTDTDPDSRLMQDADGGQLQGYNAQLAVSADGLILSPELVQDCNDRRQLQPMSRAAVHAARLVHQARCPGGCPSGRCCVADVMPSAGASPGQMTLGCGQPGCPCQADWIGILLFDAGYWAEDNLAAHGPDRLVAPGKNRDLPSPGQDPPPLPEDADAGTRMIHRLATAEGSALYESGGAARWAG